MHTKPPIISSPIVALTGGIGSGKSEAAKQFEALGIPVVDTDTIAHELTVAGMPMLADINHLFDTDFLTTDGALNRAKLRVHVFNHQENRLKLEALLHPAIYECAIKQLTENCLKLKPTYQVLVVPLLFESHRYDGIANKTMVIDCDEPLQIKRAMARSQLTESEVKAVMHAQVKRAVRLERADAIIENNGSLVELQEKISDFHKKFIKTCIVSNYI